MRYGGNSQPLAVSRENSSSGAVLPKAGPFTSVAMTTLKSVSPLCPRLALLAQDWVA